MLNCKTRLQNMYVSEIIRANAKKCYKDLENKGKSNVWCANIRARGPLLSAADPGEDK